MALFDARQSNTLAQIQAEQAEARLRQMQAQQQIKNFGATSQQQQPQTINYSNILSQLNKSGAFGPVKADAFATETQQDPLFGKQAQELRSQIFGLGGQAYDQASMYAGLAGRGAADIYADPYWRSTLSELGKTTGEEQAARGQIQRVLGGEYLQQPTELNRALSSIQGAAERGAADESAQIRSRMAQAGMGFSTADLQAQQASGAAQRGAAQDTAAKLAAENYAREREAQNQAVQQSTNLEQMRLQRLGAGQGLLSAQSGLMRGLGSEFMAPVGDYAGLLKYAQADKVGQENVERPTSMGYLLNLMAVGAQPGGAQALQGAFGK
jgi:hypothetical protein